MEIKQVKLSEEENEEFLKWIRLYSVFGDNKELNPYNSDHWMAAKISLDEPRSEITSEFMKILDEFEESIIADAVIEEVCIFPEINQLQMVKVNTTITYRESKEETSQSFECTINKQQKETIMDVVDKLGTVMINNKIIMQIPAKLNIRNIHI